MKHELDSAIKAMDAILLRLEKDNGVRITVDRSSHNGVSNTRVEIKYDVAGWPQ